MSGNAAHRHLDDIDTALFACHTAYRGRPLGHSHMVHIHHPALHPNGCSVGTINTKFIVNEVVI